MARNPIEGEPVWMRLQALAQDSPDMRDAALFYGSILPLLCDADLGITPVSLTAGEARSKMEAGLPLLQDLELELDGAAVRRLATGLARALETTGGGKQAEARRIRLVLEDNTPDFDSLLQHIAAGDGASVKSVAEDQDVDADLLCTLMRYALKPALWSWRRQLTPLVEGVRWHKGFCFVCGACSTLGELRDDFLVKHLRCGQCGADWQVSRLQCTHCGNEDHKSLGFLRDDRQADGAMIEVCEVCRGYLKVMTSFAPTPAELLTVADLATLTLDCIALERGYRRSAV